LNEDLKLVSKAKLIIWTLQAWRVDLHRWQESKVTLLSLLYLFLTIEINFNDDCPIRSITPHEVADCSNIFESWVPNWDTDIGTVTSIEKVLNQARYSWVSGQLWWRYFDVLAVLTRKYGAAHPANDSRIISHASANNILHSGMKTVIRRDFWSSRRSSPPASTG
jgi:hypothetical protein